MEKIIIQILLLIILWLIVNTILKTLLNRSQNYNNSYEINSIYSELSISVLKYRKTIMYDLIFLLILFFINNSIFFWGAIIYYVIMAIIEAILIVISLTTELNNPCNKIIIKELWLVFWSKLFDEISNIIMIFAFLTLI